MESILVDKVVHHDGRFILPSDSGVRIHVVQQIRVDCFKVFHNPFIDKQQRLVIAFHEQFGGRTGSTGRQRLHRNAAICGKVDAHTDTALLEGGDQIIELVEQLGIQ